MCLHTGFGLVGIPENLIRALRVTGPKFLTVVSNDAGWGTACCMNYVWGSVYVWIPVNALVEHLRVTVFVEMGTVFLINPRCTCTARVTVLGSLVCLSVCSATRSNETTKEWYQQVQHCIIYTGLILNLVIFVKLLYCVRELWRENQVKINMQISTGLPWLDLLALRTLEAPEVSTPASSI